MFDFGFLSLPILAATGVFGLALLSGETISIDPIVVASNLEAAGFSSTIVTRRLTDEIRELNVLAASDFAFVQVDGSDLENSVGQFEAYFGLDPLVTGARDLFGLVPYYVNGELAGEIDNVTMTVRVHYADEDRPVVDVIQVGGPAADLHQILHDTALQVVEQISPYVVALYWRRVEEAEGNYQFPRTQAVVDRYLETRPLEEHFLAYALLGRMFMLQAERQTDITPEGQQAAYAEAVRHLDAALAQRPDFEFANINLGVAHSILGNYEEADAYFARAVEIDPNELTTRVRWAESLDKQGRVREAAFQWVAAVEIDRADPTLREALAEDYLILGMVDEARGQISRAAALDPIRATSYERHLDELTGTAE